MQITNINTILAFLLALKDFSDSLSEQEQQNLKEIARQLKTQPDAWEKYTKPFLVETIQGNSQLYQAYQCYQDRLASLNKISLELLSKKGEIANLSTEQPVFIDKGFKRDSPATGYEQQLNNMVIVIGQAEKPEEAVKKLGFLDKMQQFLTQSSQ